MNWLLPTNYPPDPLITFHTRFCNSLTHLSPYKLIWNRNIQCDSIIVSFLLSFCEKMLVAIFGARKEKHTFEFRYQIHALNIFFN